MFTHFKLINSKTSYDIRNFKNLPLCLHNCRALCCGDPVACSLKRNSIFSLAVILNTDCMYKKHPCGNEGSFMVGKSLKSKNMFLNFSIFCLIHEIAFRHELMSVTGLAPVSEQTAFFSVRKYPVI